jgi:hypothetical protein
MKSTNLFQINVLFDGGLPSDYVWKFCAEQFEKSSQYNIRINESDEVTSLKKARTIFSVATTKCSYTPGRQRAIPSIVIIMEGVGGLGEKSLFM